MTDEEREFWMAEWVKEREELIDLIDAFLEDRIRFEIDELKADLQRIAGRTMTDTISLEDALLTSGLSHDELARHLETVIEQNDLGPETDAARALSWLRSQLTVRVAIDEVAGHGKPH